MDTAAAEEREVAPITEREVSDWPGSDAFFPRRWDELRLEEQLHEAERLVRRVQLQAPIRPADAALPPPAAFACETPEPASPLRFVQAPAPVAAAEAAAEAAPVPEEQPRRRRRRPRAVRRSGGSGMAWGLTGLGLSGLVCGCTLLAWSFASGEAAHWNTGLPLALISQAVLACGLLMQFSGPPQSARSRVKAASHVNAPAAAVTHVHIHAGEALAPSGFSVHYGSAQQGHLAPPVSPPQQRQAKPRPQRAAA